MRRFRIQQSLAALSLLFVCATALAGDRLAVVTAARPAERHPGLAHVLGCLAILDLSDQQKAEIRGILESAAPGLHADARAVRAAREKLRADAGAPSADVCLVGEDYLALSASLETLRSDLVSVRDQAAALLTSEQKSKLEGCLQAPGTDGAADDEGEP